MFNFEEPIRRPEQAQLRKMALDKAVALVAGDFERGGVYGVGDKEFIETISSPNSGGRISGRTALIAEKVFANYIDRLKEENRKLSERIESGKNVNEREAEDQIRRNNNEIVMIEGNCLNSLGEINDSMLFLKSEE